VYVDTPKNNILLEENNEKDLEPIFEEEELFVEQHHPQKQQQAAKAMNVFLDNEINENYDNKDKITEVKK
jgi:hypothetical protein